MSLDAQQMIRASTDFTNLNQDSISQQGYGMAKDKTINQSTKQSNRKKKTSDSISQISQKDKNRDQEFLNRKNMKQIENTQQNQHNSQQQFQQNIKTELVDINRIKEESPLQGFADLQNQINNTLAIQKHQKIKQNNLLISQANHNFNIYEKEVLPSQNYQENFNEKTLNKANMIQQNNQMNSNFLNSPNDQQKLLQFSKDKKQNPISKFSGDNLQKYSQISNEQQQQFLYENEYIPHTIQKKQNQQYFEENNIFNNSSKAILEAQYSDTKFSFNPNKINNNTNSINPYLTNTILNHSNSQIGNEDNHFTEKELCPFNQLQQEIVSQTFAIPPVIFTDEEPRYVNAAQFKRMMIMRIKRAARDLKQNKFVPQREIRSKENTEFQQQQQQNPQKSKKYKYESRHKHATNRIRDSKGRFIPKDQLQEYLEQLEKEKKLKESQNEQNCQSYADLNQNQQEQITQTNIKDDIICNTLKQNEKIQQEEQEEQKNQQYHQEELKQQNYFYNNNMQQTSIYNQTPQQLQQNNTQNKFSNNHQHQQPTQRILQINQNDNTITNSQSITEINDTRQQKL